MEAEKPKDAGETPAAQPISDIQPAPAQPISTADTAAPTVASPEPKIDKPIETPTEVAPPADAPAAPQQIIEPLRLEKPKSPLKLILLIVALLIVLGLIVGLWFMMKSKAKTPVSNTTAAQQTATTKTAAPSTAATAAQGIQLDTSKNYGNKYSNGLLPVGDGKYSTSAAKTGYVYACGQYAQNLTSSQGGAGTRGPWFTANNTEYDVNKKLHAQGSKVWTADFSNNISGSTRTIVTNDLPSHVTGTFPIAATDPAYAYDKNPNSIVGQTLTYALPASPTFDVNTANCMGGEAGIMLTGVALFNAFDAGGRDAGAWEVQDSCSGHPQSAGLYHYHTLSSCIKDVSVKTVIGYALDGFPITGPDVSNDNILTTADLDECHGLTSAISLDGKTVTMYHYVMTEDFPYSVSCFRGTTIQPPDLKNSTPQI